MSEPIKSTHKTTIIVPAYNEEEGLGLTLDKLASVINDNYEVIVVDDGSTDRTAEVAMSRKVKLLQRSKNKGKGASLREGLYYSSGDYVVWIDADNTYPVEKIPEIVEALENGYDAVVCSRLYGRDKIPRFNRVGNWLFKVLIQKIYGFKGNDVCTGLYGMKWDYLLKMRLVSERFAIEPEICMKGARMGLRFLEIPIEYKQRIGKAKLNGVVVGFEDLFMIMRLVFWKPNR